HPVWLGLVAQSVGGGLALVHVHVWFGGVPVHEPPLVILMLVTSATRTSLAVQVRFCLLPCAAQTSWIQPFWTDCADAGATENVSPATVAAKIAAIRPVVRLHAFMKILRWVCTIHSGLHPSFTR